jgi:hypothetical protein
MYATSFTDNYLNNQWTGRATAQNLVHLLYHAYYVELLLFLVKTLTTLQIVYTHTGWIKTTIYSSKSSAFLFKLVN